MEIANKSDGLRLVCRGQYANLKIDGYNSQEYLFAETQDILDVGTWHHVALTATTSTDGQYDILTFELFVDGESKGSKRARFGTEYKSGNAVAFLVGGYPTGEACFAGAASSLRISNHPLARDEFLCAEALPPVVGAVGPLGCWSLEPRGATIAAESCFPADALAPSAAGVGPSASRARTTVVSPWLNGAACAGAYDIWRLSRGALTGGQLMYSARSGLVLIFK